LLPLILCQLALFGHFALWVALLNRLHSFALRRWLREVLEKLILTALLGVLGWAVAVLILVPETFERPLDQLTAHPPAAAYFALCCLVAAWTASVWLVRKVGGHTRLLISNHSQVLRVDRQLGRLPCGDWVTRAWANVPGNQILHLEIHEKTIQLPRLPAALNGLRIAHLSDLHFTGQLTQDYFDLIVDRTNAMQADLIAVTGDIIDRPWCLPWFEQVLGRLQSRLGVFCVLGNHECRMPDKSEIVQAIQSAGLHYLGGAWTNVEHEGQTILLAGNELPWWEPAADMASSGVESQPTPALSVLLAHTPDQIQWARRYDFDLMLAGHTHGGQIRFPVIGPVLSQSWYGVKYASGVHFEPPTVLHVSRGLSGCQPLRILCRPELALLVLHSAAPD
jgi:uncharacterized protein